MTVLHQIPSALAVVGVAVAGTVAATARAPVDVQTIEVALIGGGAIVVAQIVIALAAGRQARLAREEARAAREASTKTAVKIDTIGRAVDGWRTAALREIEFLREELARDHPTNLRAQQQAEDAKSNADLQAEAARAAKSVDAVKP
jgi:hypothetical protein